jgi:3-oxoacyl-(acyl-carrier-protein) synthase
MGIVSSIGNNTQEVLASLHEAKSGITRAEKYAELGFRSQVQGAPTLNPADVIDRRAMRFLGEGAAWNHIAMEQAIQDSGLTPTEVSDVRTGIIMGSGGPSARTIVEAADITRSKGPKRVGPFAVPKAMSSTASATLATWFKIKGVNYSISSACATSNHCIGNAYETIQIGKQDLIFAGGCEELDWSLSVLFDAMGAMSSKYNATPATASRPYDISRDGFVIAGGAGVVVLEELEHAKARGARIYGEVVGYGALGRRRRALHAHGDGNREDADRLYQPACDLDAGRRSAGNRGDPKSVRDRRQMPADLGDQGIDGTFARRHRRSGSDLFAADDEQRLRLRERQHHRARSGIRRHADRAQAHRQRQARHRAVELLRLRRHQRHAGVQADGCVVRFYLSSLAPGEPAGSE